MARPKETLERLPKGWESEVLTKYKNGKSDASIRVLLNISPDLFYRWLKEEDEFSETIKKGRDLALEYWEDLGDKIITGELKGSNPTVYIFAMKNRFRKFYGDFVDSKKEDETIGRTNQERIDRVYQLLHSKRVKADRQDT